MVGVLLVPVMWLVWKNLPLAPLFSVPKGFMVSGLGQTLPRLAGPYPTGGSDWAAFPYLEAKSQGEDGR